MTVYVVTETEPQHDYESCPDTWVIGVAHTLEGANRIVTRRVLEIEPGTKAQVALNSSVALRFTISNVELTEE